MEDLMKELFGEESEFCSIIDEPVEIIDVDSFDEPTAQNVVQKVIKEELIDEKLSNLDENSTELFENTDFNMEVDSDLAPQQQSINNGENEDNNDDNINHSDTEQELSALINKTRQRKNNIEMWSDNVNRKKKECGEAYSGWENKKGIKKRGVCREERKMGAPCNSQSCKKNKARDCGKIKEEFRAEIHNTFWKTMSWEQKKVYITSLVLSVRPKRITETIDDVSRRQYTLKYTLKGRNNEIYTVCKKLFLSTFALGEWQVRNWAQNTDYGTHISNSINLQRRVLRNIGSNNTISEEKKFLINFIDSLPKLPSHYCRRNTSKFYVEPIFGNCFTSLYNEYKRQCQIKKLKGMSRFVFINISKEKNLSFQTPKKDRCNICIKYEAKNLDEKSYAEHIDSKNKARLEKQKDIERAQKGECIVLTVDLQAVKVCPLLNATALYYKTKLCVHNYTIFNINSRNVRCYWFDETQADLSSNTFASCLVDYLHDYCCEQKEVIIWSDNCSYQNKNSTLSNALLAFSTGKKVPVFQKFLTKGHTQMEVDSVHALLERKLKNRFIYVPEDYCTVTIESRKNMPYEIKRLDFNFVKNFNINKKYESIRPGRKVSDFTVNEIKEIKYTLDGCICAKLDFEEDWLDIPLPRNAVNKTVTTLSSFKQLNVEPLKITFQKWKDLQQLKEVIPTDYHSFYDNIPHQNGNKQK